MTVRGYYGDVREGSVDDSKVRVKRLFTPDGAGQKFYEEAVTWKRLKHPNVVSLLGITTTPSPPQLISDWISGGNLTEYIKDHPGADRLGLVGASHASDGWYTHNLQAIWYSQRPRVPPLQRCGSREHKRGV